MTDNYVIILEETLVKKVEILEQIHALSLKQAKLLSEEELDMEAFDSCVDEKSLLIEQVNKLDEGFEQLYARVSEQLVNQREQYAKNIQSMQGLIARIMEKSTAIQVQESRNKDAVELHFKKKKEGMAAGRKNSKAAYDYYRSANQNYVVPPQFLDKKQ